MPTTGQAAQAGKIGSSTGKLPSNKKSISKTAASTAAIETNAANNVPQNGVTGTSLSGIPLGTQVRTGKIENKYVGSQLEVGAPVYNTVQYTTDSPYTVPTTLNNQDKADLLVALGSIPGLYSSGQEPTVDWVRNQAKSGSITFRPADTTALATIMKQADQSGELYNETIVRYLNNPGLASQTFGKITSATKAAAVTDPSALVSEMTTKYMDLFNISPDKKLATSYASEVNKAERSANAKGFALSPQQKEDIFLKYVEQTATQRYAKVKATPDTADDMALEQGSLGATVRQIRAAHADNGIPASDKMIYSEAIKGIRSAQALQNTFDTIQIQAATQFPAWKEDIMKGTSVSKLIAPYAQSYEKIYGKAPKPTDLYDVAAGQTAIPVLEWEKAQWKKPDIKQTQFYKDTVKGDLRYMAEAFGVNV
jgi:hypothetical protein